MTPRFGLFLFTHRFPGQDDTEVLRIALDLADRADEIGLDDLWTTEHHFISWGVNPSATTLAAHLLGRTSRMRVGTAVTILPTHSPLAVAEQTALLDQLSGGRFDLGVGRAGPIVDYEALDRSLDHWRTGMPEALDLLMHSFGEWVSADGKHYRFRKVAPAPRPATAPHPPVFLAATSERSVDLAASHGLPLLFFLFQGPEDTTRLVVRHAAATSTEPESWAHGSAIVAHVTDTDAEAHDHVHRTMAPFFAHTYTEYVMLEDHEGGGPPPEAIADLMLTKEAVGPVDLCVERIVDRLRVPGVSRLMLHVETGTRESALANLDRLHLEVLPKVRAELAGSSREVAAPAAGWR